MITGVQPGNVLAQFRLLRPAFRPRLPAKLRPVLGALVRGLILLSPRCNRLATVCWSPFLWLSNRQPRQRSLLPLDLPARRTLIASVTRSAFRGANPSIGGFNSGGNQTPAIPASGSATYTIDANASAPGSAGLPDCNPSNLQTNMTIECYSIGRSGDWCDCRDTGLYGLSMRKGSSGPDTCT